MVPPGFVSPGLTVGANKASNGGIDVWGEDGAELAADAARNGSGGVITVIVISMVIIVSSLLMG